MSLEFRFWGLGFRVLGLGFRIGLGFRASTRAGLSIHAPIAPPHFHGGTSWAQRTSWTLPKKLAKLGFLQNPHPL